MSLEHPPLPPDDAPFDDPDNPEWTDEVWARATRVEELPPAHRDAILAAFPRTAARLRGKQKAPTKAQVTLRLDREVLEHFRATGPGWQSRINAALQLAARRAQPGES